MRTCFVPFCDNKNKDQPNRTMFLVPKEQTLFAQWAEILPKVRTLRSTDRVCHLHFRPEDVIFTFDHCINGQIFKIQRDRPKLKPHALPCLEMTTDDELLTYRVKNRLANNTKTIKNTDNMIIEQIYDTIAEDPLQTENEPQIINEEPLVDNTSIIINLQEENINFAAPTDITNNETQIIVMEDNSYGTEPVNVSTSSNINQELIVTQIIELFNLLYDKVYDVLMPNTLWGIHRCPKRSLICFSYMDILKFQVTKMISIYEDSLIQLIFNGTVIKTLKLVEDVTDLDSLSVLLIQVDKWRLCFGRETNPECEIVVESEMDDNYYCADDNEQVIFCKLCLQTC
ncbi:uncharacterized protein ACRADG_007443 [Cochliomyia hominivorax]